jgi:cullin 1
MAAISQNLMPLPTADLATTWAFLEEGLDHIMAKTGVTGVSYAKYTSLSTVVYNYCASSKKSSNTSPEQSAVELCLPHISCPVVSC